MPKASLEAARRFLEGRADPARWLARDQTEARRLFARLINASVDEIAAEIRAFAALGVDHLAVQLPERDPAGIARSMERFMAEVVPLV